MSVLGHAVMLSETNRHGWVALCECGWIGPICERAGWTDDDTLRSQRMAALVRDRATVTHGVHLLEESNRIARASAAALDSHAAYLAAVAPTVRRIGRWGRG